MDGRRDRRCKKEQRQGSADGGKEIEERGERSKQRKMARRDTVGERGKG